MRLVIAVLAFFCTATSNVTARNLRPRASVSLALKPFAVKLVGEMVNVDSVSWELKASSPMYYLMLDSENWAKVQSGALSEVYVEDSYSCLVEEGCSGFALSFHMPVNVGTTFYLAAFNPNEADVTVNGLFLAVRGGGPYSPYGNSAGPSATEWKRSPVAIDMSDHKVRRIGSTGH